MLPETIGAALFVAGLGWLGYSFRQSDVFPEASNQWIREHDQYRSSRQGALLRDILGFTLPDLMKVYLENDLPDGHHAVTRDSLRETVAGIDAEPAVHDVWIRENVTKPILLDASTRIVVGLPRLIGDVIAQPDVLDGVQSLGCFAIDLAGFRRRKARLAIRYQFQTLLLGVWLVAIIVAYLRIAPWWTVEAAVTTGVLPLLHGAELELRRQRLKADLSPPEGLE
jgi:hypothetical protein